MPSDTPFPLEFEHAAAMRGLRNNDFAVQSGVKAVESAPKLAEPVALATEVVVLACKQSKLVERFERLRVKVHCKV